MFSVKFGNNLKNSVDVTEIVIKQFSKGSNIYIPPKTILKKVFSDQTKVAKNLYLFGLQKNKQDPIIISGYHIWNKGLRFVNKNQLEDTGAKILIIVDFNLNEIAGNTIWLLNLCKSYLNDSKYTIHIVSNNYHVNNKIFTINLMNSDKINILPDNNIDIFNKLNNLNLHNQYHNIIVRSLPFIKKCNTTTQFLNKLIIYAMDIHVAEIQKLDFKYHELWCQSKKFEKIYLDIKVPDVKIKITPPTAFKYNFTIPKRNDNKIRLIYCGTLRDQENILNIISEFEKIYKKFHELMKSSRLTKLWRKVCRD